MIKGINESKTLTKHMSCEYKCKFHDRKYNLNQKWNNNKCQHDCKNPKKHRVCEKIIFEILYLARIIDNSVITLDKIIKETKSIPSNVNAKKDGL